MIMLLDILLMTSSYINLNLLHLMHKINKIVIPYMIIIFYDATFKLDCVESKVNCFS